MHYADSEVQRLLRDTARSYLADNYPWERLYAAESAAAAGIGPDELASFAKLGWLGLLAPEDSGGGGLGLLEAAVVVEELGHAAVPSTVIVSNVAADLLTRAGRMAEVASLVSGATRYTVSQATRTRERPVPGAEPLRLEGGLLAGELPAVPFAATSDFVLGGLTVDGAAGFAALPLAAATLAEARQLDRATFSHVAFVDANAGGTVLLATGEEALRLAGRCEALMTAFGLMELVGAMQRVVRMTADYISNRVQFGQPVAKFQAARHRAAEMMMHAEGTRWAAYRAIWDYETCREAAGLWKTKLWAERAAAILFENAHMLHGGIGVGTEYPLHLFTQILAANSVRDGAANEMCNRVVESLGVGTQR